MAFFPQSINFCNIVPQNLPCSTNPITPVAIPAGASSLFKAPPRTCFRLLSSEKHKKTFLQSLSNCFLTIKVIKKWHQFP